MSVFKVALNNVEQGVLDLNPGTATPGAVTGQGLGGQMNPSVQRTVYITGPNLVNRLLVDGATFTDCNYWKRFTYPNVPLNEAFIEVVTDDGSIYSDNPDENTFPSMGTIAAVGGSTFDDNDLDVLGTLGSHAIFTQLTNNGAGAVQIRLNGLTGATFTLGAGDTQVYNSGDLVITRIQVDNSASGAADADVDYQLSLRSVCES